jgi:hypothetical protein
MIRGNPISDSQRRLWISMAACLKNFPPSQLFENFLECYLLNEIESGSIAHAPIARKCIEFMHEAVFLYGYQIKIHPPTEEELEQTSMWFAGEDRGGVNFNLDGERIVATKEKMKEAIETKRWEEEKLREREDKKDKDKIQEVPLDEEDLRGTRANWIKRFKLFSKGKKEIGPDEFIESLFDQEVWDNMDKEVLMLLVMGTWPSRRRTLVKCYLSDDKLFHPLTAKEKKESDRRMDILRVCVGPPTDLIRENEVAVYNFFLLIVGRMMQAADTKSECKEALFVVPKQDIGITDDMCEEDIIEKVQAMKITWDLYRDIVISGMRWLSDRAGDVINQRAAAKQHEKMARAMGKSAK